MWDAIDRKTTPPQPRRRSDEFQAESAAVRPVAPAVQRAVVLPTSALYANAGPDENAQYKFDGPNSSNWLRP